jgi:hypothetical protein
MFVPFGPGRRPPRLGSLLAEYEETTRFGVAQLLLAVGIADADAMWLDYGTTIDTLWIATDPALIRVTFPRVAPRGPEPTRLAVPGPTERPLGSIASLTSVRLETTSWVVVRDPQLTIDGSGTARFSLDHPRREPVAITNSERVPQLVRFALEVSRRARGR